MLKREIDMTHGKLLGKILLFSLPLAASNVLQLLFNAADVVVIGRYSGKLSLAAVGSTNCIINLFINLLVGLSVGVNVVAAYSYGNGTQGHRVPKIMSTCILLALGGGAIVGILGFCLAPLMLHLTSSPEDIMPLALRYLRIYFLGTPFSMIYNYGASLLRARGDTRRPLLYLTCSGVVNVGLNLFFVLRLHLDVAGVAIATVLSQLLSAILILRFFCISKDELHLSVRQLKFDSGICCSIMKIGVPAGIQGSLFAVSNVMMQGAINTYDNYVIAGSSASVSIEGFIYMAMNAFHQAAQTFVGQNVAAGKTKHVHRVVWLCLLNVSIVAISFITVVLLFAEPLTSIYNEDPAVVAAAVYRLRVVLPVYLVYGIGDVMTGAIRGHGISMPPLLINLACSCLFRVVWLACLPVPDIGVRYVYATWPISWILLLAVLLVYWLSLYKKGYIGNSRPQGII